ncbi:6558_t:CDS:2, partial [Acaulospora morrowiae]
IGYHQICNDVNDLVMQGALLILFPPTPTTGYRRPDKEGVKERLRELISLGFNLTYPVIGDIMQLFEPKLSDIGNILLESFDEIKNDPVNEFMHRILIESIKPERNFKKYDIWKFLNQKLGKIYDRKDTQINTGNKVAKKMDDHLSTKGKKRIGKLEFQEKAFLDVMDRYIGNTNKSTGTSLIFTPKFYEWVLETFGAEAKITKRCFDDILKTRVNIDKQFIQTPDTKVQECTYEAISNIWNIYCNKHVSFEHKHTQHLSQAAHEDILDPLFKGFLWRLFKLDPTHDHEAVTPSTTKKRHDDLRTLMIWYGCLVNLKDHLMISGDKFATREFKQSLETFLDVLERSEFKKGSKKRKQRLVINQSRKRRRKKET